MRPYKFFKQQVIVCIGSGGVGKTSVAASLAAMAAAECFSVLVLTIDPSKRLAQTLGIEGADDIVLVPGQNFKGKLYAAVVDHKRTFDNFILKVSERSATAQKIFDNRLYKQLSTSLSGSQEFTCLEKLYSAYESKKYDVIILDTPPAKHAIDFLNAPEKLAQIFNEGIAKWFRDPKAQKRGIVNSIFNQGTKQVLKALEVLTGSDFIKELSDFFVKIELHQERLKSRVLASQKLLVHPNTEFCLVTAFDESKLIEAKKIFKEIRRNGYNLKYFVFNRAYPEWLASAQEKGQGTYKNQEIQSLYNEIQNYYKEQAATKVKYRKELSKEVLFIELPEYNEEISNLESLQQIEKTLGQEIE